MCANTHTHTPWQENLLTSLVQCAKHITMHMQKYWDSSVELLIDNIHAVTFIVQKKGHHNVLS